MTKAKAETFTILRRIEIDAGHRIPEHHSKCRQIHGHRYVIEAFCEGPLQESGSQEGMILDFSFLKEEMIKTIDEYCDHRLILYWGDKLVDALAPRVFMNDEVGIAEQVAKNGFCVRESPWGYLYLIPYIPTAENLARHWAWRLESKIRYRSDNKVKLIKLRVHETPNCVAEYTL